MKYIVTKENYIQFIETDDSNQITRQLGFGIDGVTYVVNNDNVKFYLKEDYFYKNSVWSIDLPAQINGEYYDKDTIGDGLAGIYDPSTALAVTSVNGKKGDVWLTAADVDAYSKSQTDNMLDTKADKETTYTKEEVDSLLDGIEQTTTQDIQNVTEQITNVTNNLTQLTEKVDNIENIFNEYKTQTDEHFTTIEGDIEQVNQDIAQVTERVTTIESEIQTLKDKDTEQDGKIDQLESDTATLRSDLDSLSQRVTTLENEAKNHLVASNIKAGTNISVSLAGNDVTISTVGIATTEGLAELEQKVSTNTNDIAGIKTTLDTKEDKGTAQTMHDQLQSGIDANEQAIQAIQQQLTDTEHFRGYYNTTTEIQSLDKCHNGDFAYNAETGTKWVYSNGTWSDSLVPVVDETVPKTEILPLMDGVATIGDSNTYAAGNHVHPHDTTKANVGDLTALQQDLNNYKTTVEGQLNLKADKTELTTLSGDIDSKLALKADKETTYTKSEVNSLLDGKVDDGYCYSKGEVDGLLNNKANVGDSYTKSETDNLLNSKADKADTYTKQEVDDKLKLKADQSNTYTKQEVDDAIANVDVTEQLQNYYNKTEIDEKLANVKVDAYTKAETDNLLNTKANKFTDVDDILLVDQLPETPNDRILYLIPISAE